MHAYIEALLAFLRPIKTVEILGSFELTIGRQTYQAVRYRQTCQTLPGCPAYDRGEREFTEERSMVAGQLPPSYVRNPGGSRTLGHHYVFDNDRTVEWYVIGYMQEVERLSPEQRAHHPQVEGHVIPGFYLGVWTVDVSPLGLRAKITKGRATRLEEQPPRCGGAIR